MSLKIRLARGGAHKRPYYRVVVTDTRSPRDGRFIEKLGYYDPLAADDHPEKLVVKQERIRHWLDVGAKPSERVVRLLAHLGMMAKPTPPAQTKKNQPKAKTQERLKAEQEAAAQEATSDAEAEGMVEHPEAAPSAKGEETSPPPAEEKKVAPTQEASSEEEKVEEETKAEEASKQEASEQTPTEKPAAKDKDESSPEEKS